MFRRYQSQPVDRVITLINPVLSGWVNYFAVGHAGECFRYIKNWGGEEGPAPYQRYALGDIGRREYLQNGIDGNTRGKGGLAAAGVHAVQLIERSLDR